MHFDFTLTLKHITASMDYPHLIRSHEDSVCVCVCVCVCVYAYQINWKSFNPLSQNIQHKHRHSAGLWLWIKAVIRDYVTGVNHPQRDSEYGHRITAGCTRALRQYGSDEPPLLSLTSACVALWERTAAGPKRSTPVIRSVQ